MSENQLSEIAAFLAEPASYLHSPVSVSISETHASVVALSGPLVFKVKKPVNFGFLDYSTLERRRHFCEREVELNRRLCPGVYLGVVAIVRNGGRLRFAPIDSADSVVEYAVQMRRLDNQFFLSTLLDRGQVTEDEVKRVADVLIEFYERQPPVAVSASKYETRLHETVLENWRGCAQLARGRLGTCCGVLCDYGSRFIASHGELIRQRVESGWIRDGHGDLRPGHVHLSPDGVRIYDCIEFNDELRVIDAAEDAAFLSMELAYAGRWDLSQLFVERMSGFLGDGHLLTLFDFYHSYRAAVRAKVAMLLAADARSPESRRRECIVEGNRYLQHSFRFALFGSKPTAVVVMGQIATGKSTLATGLGDILGWPMRSSDRVRKELAGLPLERRPDEPVRRQLYSPSMTEQTYSQLIQLARGDVAAHHGVILDATFGRRVFRDQLFRELPSDCQRHSGMRSARACATGSKPPGRSLMPGWKTLTSYKGDMRLRSNCNAVR
jgi:aminoglycoside phosphotransferase family enzyme